VEQILTKSFCWRLTITVCFAGMEAAKEPQMTATQEKDRDSQTLTSLTCQQ